MIQPIRMNNCSHLNLLQKLIEGTRWRHQYVINDVVTSSLRRWWRHLYSRVNIFPKHTYIHIIYPDFWLVESQLSETPYWRISESWFSEVKFWNSGISKAEMYFHHQMAPESNIMDWNPTGARLSHLSWPIKYDSFLNWHEFDQNWFLNLGWGLT